MMISIEDPATPELKKFENFVNITAHELKTPITVLKAYLQMIARQLQQGDQQSCIKTVERMEIQVDKLLHLISDLQDGIMSNSEELHCLMNKFSVNGLLEQCAQDVLTTYPGLRVELALDSAQPVIKADKERIEQVVHNLITNAVKYSGDQKCIKLTSKIQKETVIISVTDNGYGIPAAQQAHVFDQFYRVKNSPGKPPQGFGLGLFICAEILRKHDGQIWVVSQEGIGSEFCFSLPLSV